MTSPPQKASEHGSTVHRLITPTIQILVAAVILFTGAGVSAVFWKMPTSAKQHELYRSEIADPNLTAVPLPNEAVASISVEERSQIVLPALDVAPVADIGVEKYAQIYEAPASLVAQNPVQEKTPSEVAEESAVVPITPQKFEPVRHIVEKKPISIELVNREFPEKPTSVSTADKSDELLSMFHFAENGKSDFVDSTKSAPPADPFSTMTAPVSRLQPLQPLQVESLSPLLPLQELSL